MLEKQRLHKILLLALPIIGGMASQNILNLVDTYFVGHLGNSALAAVGLGGFICFMFQAAVLSVSTGVQAMAARRFGEGKMSYVAAPLNAGLLVVLCVGSLISFALYPLVEWIYPYINNDISVLRDGIPYLKLRIIGIVFIGVNFTFRGFWNATGRPMLYVRTLLITHVANILLNYLLIFGHFGFPKWGVYGAGVGSMISTMLGTLILFFLGLKEASCFGFLKKLPNLASVRDLVRLSLPNGIQQTFFAGGFVTLYWIIGQVGTAELAAANVLINILLICILPGLGLGLASATLVGQALGRGDFQDATAWGWDVGKVGALGISLLGLPMIFASESILSLFLKDISALNVAILPLKFTGITIGLDVFGLILMHSLLGSGATKEVMKVAVPLQWLCFLPLAYLVGPILDKGLFGIWVLQGTYRGFQALIFSYFWSKGDWQQIKI